MFKPSLLSFCALCTPALADVPQVVTDIAPVHGLTARVMEGVGAPGLIIAAGASPHDYALRPSDARALSGADLVFWVGPELTPGLEKPMHTLAEGAINIELLDADETRRLAWRETFEGETHEEEHAHDDAHDDHDTHDEEHAHDDAHDDHDTHEDAHGHDHHGTDPHAWLDPENGKAWLSVIAEALAELDPENAALYRANATQGQAEIDSASAEIKATLAPLSDRPYVVFHDAYQYFEQRFGLHPAGAISLGDAADPSPARISALRDTVRDAGATCVFSEPQFNAGLVATVFDGSDARTAVIDPLGTEIPTGPGFYPALLRNLAGAMAGCL